MTNPPTSYTTSWDTTRSRSEAQCLYEIAVVMSSACGAIERVEPQTVVRRVGVIDIPAPTRSRFC